MSVNNDFIFGATKSGTIEVWLKERLTKVASIKNAKITSLASDADGEMLFAGSSDGRIQVGNTLDCYFCRNLKLKQISYWIVLFLGFNAHNMLSNKINTNIWPQITLLFLLISDMGFRLKICDNWEDKYMIRHGFGYTNSYIL